MVSLTATHSVACVLKHRHIHGELQTRWQYRQKPTTEGMERRGIEPPGRCLVRARRSTRTRPPYPPLANAERLNRSAFVRLCSVRASMFTACYITPAPSIRITFCLSTCSRGSSRDAAFRALHA